MYRHRFIKSNGNDENLVGGKLVQNFQGVTKFFLNEPFLIHRVFRNQRKNVCAAPDRISNGQVPILPAKQVLRIEPRRCAHFLEVREQSTRRITIFMGITDEWRDTRGGRQHRSSLQRQKFCAHSIWNIATLERPMGPILFETAKSEPVREFIHYSALKSAAFVELKLKHFAGRVYVVQIPVAYDIRIYALRAAFVH